MRIAQIAPLYEPVPPPLYGGTERIVSFLTEELVARGHEVTLFASGESKTTACLVAGRGQALRLDPAPKKSEIAAHLAMLDEVRRRADEFDLLHFHLSHFQHFPFFEHIRERTVTTPHGRLDYVDLPGAYARWHGFPMISISDRQRKPLPDANWVGTVYHGLPVETLPFRARRERSGERPYLAFLGRLSRDKRPDRAIEIAKRAGLQLRIAAKVGVDDRAYFDDNIEQRIDGDDVVYLGEVGEAEKADLLTNAEGLVFPIDWPEPFGLVVIESMAYGTPVIAWREGAMPEIVDQGEAGFVVDSIEEAVEKVKLLAPLDRHRIRRIFEERFSVRRMVDDYERIYASVVAPSRSPKLAEVTAGGT
ncbi:glycosyltransferase family 4 protein [Pseudaminobacter sp. 19-2017]|uniref:Glycosyltransferase family 4 protein n=1 Tax=Pseudaminobacter soli (ex Zhang et al. 2022) TaxID=2831468 RepID=A0A942E1P2_9HYPH|nr:glycosyltransferase family 4 protein [Pseudaminobacter soli]MBS3652209.1 glycosyltransferase family 4 protein [Pseudaminobacter soli]